MKKTFCDCCGAEVTKAEISASGGTLRVVRWKFQPGNAGTSLLVSLKVQVSITPEQFDECVDLCDRCRWTILDSIDPRPKAKG
jgi:hypothetical protein